MDVETTFLNGGLEEENYINQQKEFIAKGKENKVCKLLKFLHRLIQAPKQWHKKLNKFIIRFGCSINEHDKCFYLKVIDYNYPILCLYVDDILNFETSLEMILKVKDYLSQKFDLKDLGPKDMILGMKISMDPK